MLKEQEMAPKRNDRQSRLRGFKSKLLNASSLFPRLGVRLCGSLWYNPHTKSYRRSDKYTGRELDVEGFETAVSQLFSDGHRLRKYVVGSILSHIRDLRRTVERLGSYRFYSR